MNLYIEVSGRTGAGGRPAGAGSDSPGTNASCGKSDAIRPSPDTSITKWPVSVPRLRGSGIIRKSINVPPKKRGRDRDVTIAFKVF